MINFSELNNINKTQKDHIIQDMILQTGLEKPKVEKLYQNLLFESEGNFETLKKKLTDFTKVETSDVFGKIAEKLKEIFSITTKVDKNELIIKLVHENNSDIVVLIKMICYILFVKNNKTFAKIADLINLDFKLTDLMESAKPYVIDTVDDGSDNIGPDIELYSDLRSMLAKNNKKWGNNYHLDNVYNSIVSYLDKEIDEFVNKNNVNTVTDTFHLELLQQLVNGRINPMYKSIDILRTMIPDVQTLVFDLMCLVTAYVRNNEKIMSNISRDSVNGYMEATRTLYGKISSSRMSSKVCVKYIEPITDASKPKEEQETIEKSTNGLI